MFNIEQCCILVYCIVALCSLLKKHGFKECTFLLNFNGFIGNGKLGIAVCGFLSILLPLEWIDFNHQFTNHTQAKKKVFFKTRINYSFHGMHCYPPLQYSKNAFTIFRRFKFYILHQIRNTNKCLPFAWLLFILL